MAEEKVLTRHPQGKSGRNISRESYGEVKGAILAVLRAGELTHAELMARVAKGLAGRFAGNVSWYAETVKLDLEARKAIERTESRPQRYRLRQAAARRTSRRNWRRSSRSPWPRSGGHGSSRTTRARCGPRPGSPRTSCGAR